MRKISELLKEEREKKGYTLSYIEEATKIKSEFLKAIEEGKFHDLPSESYALGFVKNYADFLGIQKNKITALFRREYKEEKQDILPEFRKRPDRFREKSPVSSKNVFISLIFLVVITYIFFQYNSLIFGPPLKIISPKEGEIVKNNILQANGKTEPYSVVSIDGEEVPVNIDGSFKKSLYLFPGNKKITVIAKNRFGKETKEILNIRVE